MSESTMVAPVIDNIEEKQSTPTKSMPVKTKLKDYGQKLMILKARIRYREHVIKIFRKHLKNGTFPHCLRADVSYFLCCTRKGNVCVTPSLIVFQRPAGREFYFA